MADQQNSIFIISVSTEDADRLYTAYKGLPDNRKSIVNDEVERLQKDEKLSMGQALRKATFTEIFVPKLKHYEEKGLEFEKEEQKKISLMIGALTTEQKAQLLASLQAK